MLGEAWMGLFERKWCFASVVCMCPNTFLQLIYVVSSYIIML